MRNLTSLIIRQRERLPTLETCQKNFLTKKWRRLIIVNEDDTARVIYDDYPLANIYGFSHKSKNEFTFRYQRIFEDSVVNSVWFTDSYLPTIIEQEISGRPKKDTVYIHPMLTAL
jgi:hypothetical protein